MASSLLVGTDVFYQGMLEEIKKSKEHLRPIYEAFSNSWESVKLHPDKMSDSEIIVRVYMNPGTVEGVTLFERIEIEDNGVGFNEVNYGRMRKLKDNRKGFCNRGSGRIQFLHFFDKAEYQSTFRSNGEFSRRTLTLSKKWLARNAIMLHDGPHTCDSSTRRTVLTLKSLLDEADQSTYDELTAGFLKRNLIERYVLEFCAHRENLPYMEIAEYLDGKLVASEAIESEDVPAADKTAPMSVAYHHLADRSSDLVPTGKTEELELHSFKISADNLDKNEIKLTSKGEIVDEPEIPLESLEQKDAPDGFRYLFLVSGEYLNSRDSDTRGALRIITKREFMKSHTPTPDLFDTEQVFLDDIQSKANESILELYDEINDAVEDKKKDIESLRAMFLLDENTLDSLSIKLGEPEESILRRVYQADATLIAKRDAEIKSNMERIKDLDPASENYHEELNAICSDVVRAVPIQNRTALAHYVARRRLVLELLDSILKKELKVQEACDRNIDERLLHNLIFQQSSDAPEDSDLWLINEDFVYFKGSSEARLCELMVDGKKLFRDEFAVKEEEYLKSLGENRKLKRPDILLFPDEGKCIIIELKNPDVNVSDHLNQITKYAYLIQNFSVEAFGLETFYGYLLGQKINTADVRAADSDYIEAYHFDYLFRPYKRVVGENGRRDGSIYTEVIQYSTLLARAIKRNEIYIKKLTENREPQD